MLFNLTKLNDLAAACEQTRNLKQVFFLLRVNRLSSFCTCPENYTFYICRFDQDMITPVCGCTKQIAVLLPALVKWRKELQFKHEACFPAPPCPDDAQEGGWQGIIKRIAEFLHTIVAHSQEKGGKGGSGAQSLVGWCCVQVSVLATTPTCHIPTHTPPLYTHIHTQINGVTNRGMWKGLHSHWRQSYWTPYTYQFHIYEMTHLTNVSDTTRTRTTTTRTMTFGHISKSFQQVFLHSLN